MTKVKKHTKEISAILKKGLDLKREFDHQSLHVMTKYTHLKYRPFQRGWELKREFDHGQISEATGENH